MDLARTAPGEEWQPGSFSRAAVVASAATALATGIRHKSRHVERASIDWWNN